MPHILDIFHSEETKKMTSEIPQETFYERIHFAEFTFDLLIMYEETGAQPMIYVHQI